MAPKKLTIEELKEMGISVEIGIRENIPQSTKPQVIVDDFDRHKEAFQAFQSLGCYDPGGLENSRR
jgi:hypothetical protein